MQRPFTTQAELLMSSSDITHPILNVLEDTEALLDESKSKANSPLFMVQKRLGLVIRC